ncbi:hypothetical protein ABEB36_014086 [Hypothenemus hampei]|uniref:BED-type domain-containing protein n=1 Tax=Hypothenemus hampei TaxID=57062 RepID=A0ABD1E390_HYPHA
MEIEDFIDQIENHSPSPLTSRNSSLTVLDGTFFTIKEELSTPKKIVAQCVKCLPNKTSNISGNRSSSNFLKHLRRVHGNDAVEEYNEHLRKKPKKNQPEKVTTINKRVSVALACRRIKGSHTAEKINEMFGTIHNEYKINYSTIMATVTDNASNFCKAFKEFGIQTCNILSGDNNDEDDENDENEIDEESRLENLPIYFPEVNEMFTLLPKQL